MGDNIDVLREEVENGLPALTVEGLENVCLEIDLPIQDTVKGNKSKVFRHLLTHLWTEGDKEDQGYATYKIVHTYLTQMKVVKPEIDGVNGVNGVEVLNPGSAAVKPSGGGVETQGDDSVDTKSGLANGLSDGAVKLKTNGGLGSGQVAKPLKNTGVVEIQTKLQALKINGVIGGETNNITFDNLNFQITNAVAIGYTEQSICGAVLKAICPSNSLRVYFETEKNLKVANMLDILRPYLVQNKDAASYFAELCSAKQRPPDKTAMDFVVRLLGLKNRIYKLSDEEGTPFDRNLMRKQFFKTMYSGMKNNNIRAEVRENCKSVPSTDLPDHELMRVVAEAMGNEALRVGNFATTSEVSLVEIKEGNETSQGRKVGKQKENLLPNQVEKQKQEIQVLRKEVEELKGQNGEIKSLLVANNNLLKAHVNSAQVNMTPLNPNAAVFNRGGVPGTGGGGGGFVQPQNQNQNGQNFTKKKGFPRKCANCHQNNVFRCTHCWECGGRGHKRGECPEEASENP